MKMCNIKQRQFFNKLYEKSKEETNEELTDDFIKVNHEYLSQRHIMNLHDEIKDLLNVFEFECFLHRKLFNDKSESIDRPT